MVLQDVRALLSWNIHVCYLAWPKGLCRSDCIKGFEMERLSWIIGVGSVLTPRVLIRAEGQWEAGGPESEIRRGSAVGLEDGGRGHKPRSAGVP